jgi:F0F1-type ATP synthase membrane subunit b/b'
MMLAENSIQLVPDGTLLLHFLFIGLMVSVLGRTLLRPINQILKEREKRVRESLSEAKATTASIEEKRNRYQSDLRQARIEGYRLLEQVRAGAIKEREERVLLVKEELGEWASSQLENLRNQEEQVRGELEMQASTIGTLISSQILGGRTS